MNKILQESIRLRKPFTENYTLITETKVRSGYFDMETKTKTRWALRVMAISEEGDAELELLTLEHIMVETNNENLNDIIKLNQVFGRMYSELHIVINLKGEVIKIINLEHIKNKWEETKIQLLKIQQQDPALLQLVTINDEIFASSAKIKIAIENNEFFNHYFGKIYANKLPISRKIIAQKNVLQTADAEWFFNFKHSPEFNTQHLDDVIIRYNGEAATHQTDWKRKAYGHLSDIDSKSLEPKLIETGSYKCNFKTGKLHFAQRNVTETVLTDIINGSIKYTLESDSYKRNDNNLQNQNLDYNTFRVID